jgi:hypothetical protein
MVQISQGLTQNNNAAFAAAALSTSLCSLNTRKSSKSDVFLVFFYAVS